MRIFLTEKFDNLLPPLQSVISSCGLRLQFINNVEVAFDKLFDLEIHKCDALLHVT